MRPISYKLGYQDETKYMNLNRVITAIHWMVLGCPGGCWFTVALMNVLMDSFAFSLD
jgi:hypothetical protein